MTSAPSMKPFARLLGHWTTEATHPAFPGLVVHGTVETSWLEGERFLIQRSRTEHPDFPDGITIIGFTERDRPEKENGQRTSDPSSAKPALTMHYFDSRGVFRVYDVSIDEKDWRFWRNSSGFSQRFTGTYADGGNTIDGISQLCEDDKTWNDDLKITYRRRN
jgi:hypothetical protein